MITEQQQSDASSLPSSGRDLVARLAELPELPQIDIDASMDPRPALLIEPDVGDIHWADFSQSAALIQIGRDAARDALRDFRPGNRWYQRLWTLGIGAARSRRDA